MKNQVLIFFLVFFSIFSCSDDDSDDMILPNIMNPSFDTDLMLGVWQYTTYKINNEVFTYSHNVNCSMDYFAFYNEETKPFEYEETIYTTNMCVPETIIFTWKVQEDQLQFYFGEESVFIYDVISINDQEFVVKSNRDFDNDGIIDELEIRAIKI